MGKKVWQAAAGLAIVGAAVFLVRSTSGRPDVRAQAGAPEREPSQSAAALEPRHGLAWVARDEDAEETLQRYHLQVHNDFRPSADASGLLIGFEGDLVMGEVARVDGLTWLYLHPDDIEFAVDAGGEGLTAEQQAHLERELEQGYFAGRNAQGQIVEYRFSRQPSSVAQGFLRLIAVATQAVTPEANELPARWTVAEVDTAGEAQVHYERASEERWLKSKNAYTKVLTDAGLQPSSEERTLRGKGELTFRAGKLALATLTEHSMMRLGDAAMANDAEVRIVRKDGEVSEDVETLRTKLKQLVSVSAFRLPRVQLASEEDRLRAVLAGKSLDDLLKDLAKLSVDDEASRRALLDQFEADLKLHPEHAKELGARMRSASERERSLIMSALSNAETFEGTVALREISEDDTLSGTVRETATVLLGFAREADEETVVRLERVSRDAKHPRSTTATLALGSLAQFSRDTDPEQADSIVEELLQRLRKADSADVAMELLSALGNSGDPRLVEALEPWRSAEHTGVRAGAFFALRLIDGETPARLMAQAALQDPDAYVRARAMVGLAVKATPIAFDVALRSLAEESDATVRMAALQVLGTFPGAQTRDVLTRVSSSDPDEAVRAAARSLLGQNA